MKMVNTEQSQTVEVVNELPEVRATTATAYTHSPVADEELEIIVDEMTRSFVLPEGFNPIVGVVGDCNSEVVSFIVPKIIEGHDVYACAEKKIFWKNKNSETSGEFTVENIVENEEDLTLEWLISDAVAANSGELSFELQISDYDDQGQVTYRWRATGGKGLMILPTEFDGSVNETPQKSFVRLVDQSTGKHYQLYVSDGKLNMVESEV